MPTIVKLSNSDRTREVYVNADRIAFFLADGSGNTDIYFGPGQIKVVADAPDEVLAAIGGKTGSGDE